jgi:hypothetical protein
MEMTTSLDEARFVDPSRICSHHPPWLWKAEATMGRDGYMVQRVPCFTASKKSKEDINNLFCFEMHFDAL